MTKVALVNCLSYDGEAVKKALNEAFHLLGGLDKFVRPGQKVLLKVNMLSPRPPEQAVTTHPTVVKALALLVRDAGGEPWVGDSSGGMMLGQSPTSRSFEATGIREAAEEAGAKVVNFDTAGVEGRMGKWSAIPLIYLAKPLFEADVIISVPKLKTHSGTLFTGAVKNMYGAVPGFRKAQYHREAPDFKDFTRVILDIYSHVKPHLAVMDAVVGMEGNGPSAGNPRKLGLILAGADGVALDAVACAAVGIEPMAVATLREAARLKLGEADLSEITVVGIDKPFPLVKSFKVPSTFNMQSMPPTLTRFFLGFLAHLPVVDQSRCSGCRFCQENCPVQAIGWECGGQPGPGAPQIDYGKCISCLCCQELCPQKAVEMQPKGMAARLLTSIIRKSKEWKRKKWQGKQN